MAVMPDVTCFLPDLGEQNNIDAWTCLAKSGLSRAQLVAEDQN